MNKKLMLFINLLKMGYKNKKPFIITTYYKTLSGFLNILYKHGFIQSYHILPNHKLKIILKYTNDTPMIQHLKPISTPTYKIYKTYDNLFNEKKKTTYGIHRDFYSKSLNPLKKTLDSFHLNHLEDENVIHTLFKDVSWIKQTSHHMNHNIVIPQKYKNINNTFSDATQNSLLQIKHKRSFMNQNTLNSYSKMFPQEAFFILSTPQGFMTHREAYKKRLGGLLICEIY